MEADDAPEAAVQLLCTRAFIFSVFTSKKKTNFTTTDISACSAEWSVTLKEFLPIL